MNTSMDHLLQDRPDGQSLKSFVRAQLKPRGPLLTPFNVISGAILLAAAAILAVRFATGLHAVGAHQLNPWGLWVGFNVVAGVAMAGGAYVVTFMVYVLGMKKLEPIVRPTVLFGFLSYAFYAGALFIDLGRPWKVINPIIGNDFGLSSVLFLVAWHFLLYMAAQAVEFSPALMEWLRLERLHRWVSRLSLGAVIFGITLSILHQSGLGALFLMAKPKIHPLWFSEYIPILFLTSSIFAGLSMVIIVSTVTQRVFRSQIDDEHRRAEPGIVLSLGKVCAGTMFVYLFLQLLTFLHEKRWVYAHDSYFAWYLTEIVGFILVPMLLFGHAVRQRSTKWVRTAAAFAVVGVVLNRLDLSIIAFRWWAPTAWPSWKEAVVAAAVIMAQLWVFRWIALRLPVGRAAPEWAHHHAEPDRTPEAVGTAADASF